MKYIKKAGGNLSASVPLFLNQDAPPMSCRIAQIESEIKNVIAFGAFEFRKKIIGSEAFSRVFTNERSYRSTTRSHVKGLVNKSDEHFVLAFDFLMNLFPRYAAGCPSGCRKTDERKQRDEIFHKRLSQMRCCKFHIAIIYSPI